MRTDVITLPLQTTAACIHRLLRSGGVGAVVAAVGHPPLLRRPAAAAPRCCKLLPAATGVLSGEAAAEVEAGEGDTDDTATGSAPCVFSCAAISAKLLLLPSAPVARAALGRP